jgi:hypothetical protein
MVLIEISARCEGYAAPLIQPAAAGPVMARWKEAWLIHQEVWDRCWEHLRPGTPLEVLASQTVRSPYRVDVSIAGTGLGDDLPWIEGGIIRGAPLAGAELREGETLLLKPTISWTEGAVERCLTAGSTLAINASGAEEIGLRSSQILSWG